MITTAGGMQVTGPATRTPPSPTGPARKIRGLPFLVAHAVLAAAAGLIAGCGDGNGEPRDPSEAVPGAPTAHAAREGSVEATLGMRVTGSGIHIRGVSPDSVVIHTHGGYGVFFAGRHDCALSGVTVTGGVRDPDDRATSGGVVARDATVEISDCRIAGNLGDSAGFREAAAPLLTALGRYPALEGSSFVTTWRGR